MAGPKSKDFAGDLGTEMVTLFVGEEKRKFQVHKKLLCDKVPVFKAMFAGAWKETEEGVAYLPEDKVSAVEVLVEWLYRGYISPAEAKRDAHKAITCAYAFCFAEKYCIDTLMDQSISWIMETQKNHKLLYRPQDIADLYNSTRDGSRLRLYLLRILCRALLHHEGVNGFFMTDKICEALREAPDLLQNMVAALRNSHNQAQPIPFLMPVCDYHQHDSKTPCPYQTKKIEVMFTDADADADAHQSKKRKVE